MRETDEEFMAKLRANPAYRGVNIDLELAKMDAWLMTPKAKGRKKSRGFIVNWLNKVDPAVETPDEPRMNPVNKSVAARALERKPGDPRAVFVRALTTMAAVFRIEVDDLLLEAYWEALRIWPPEALEAAAKHLIGSNHFFPRPVEWAEEAREWVQAEKARRRHAALALVQTTEPPLKAAEVHKLVKDLAAKLATRSPQE